MTEENTTSTKLTQPTGNLNVNTFGYFLDGWSDIIEGMGDKAGEVRENLLTQLKAREMPNIETKYMNASVNLASGYRRAYAINTTKPGATTTIYIAKHGKDLYASWRTFIKPVLNWNTLGILILASVMLGIFFGGLNLRGGFSFIGWITGMITIFILGAIVIGVISRLIRGNFMAFFFIEPNIFDAEDITAMSLSTHKSILRALDTTGIDITKLRLKRDFKGGRLGETV